MAQIRFDVLTLFPEMFSGFLSTSIIGRAREKGLIAAEVIDFRQFSTDKHRTVDDTPYGGGGGMVLKPEPIFRAVEHLLADESEKPPILLMSPQGKPFTQRKAEELARHRRLVLICGHYEGFDERIRQHLATEELSIGDYVLTGGELAAMVVIDCVSRLIPGVLGNESAAAEDSFSMGLLEYPQYTRPARFPGMEGTRGAALRKSPENRGVAPERVSSAHLGAPAGSSGACRIDRGGSGLPKAFGAGGQTSFGLSSHCACDKICIV